MSPISFLRASAHILLASFVAITLRHAIDPIAHSAEFGTLLTGAFLIGFYPRLGIDILIDRAPKFQIKRVDEEARKLCKEFPIDMVMGIDTHIKFRLAEFEIEDVQNLATANPILLFVETPYGIYEIMDWVAQAQLIVAVDVDQLKHLREINVRTVFDIEQYAISESTRGLLASALNGTRSRGITDKTVMKVAETICDDLHVQRLRQIWRNIELKLNFDLPVVEEERSRLGLSPYHYLQRKAAA